MRELEEAREIIERVRGEPKKWLFGLDKAIDNLVLATFTLVPYMGDDTMLYGQAHVFLNDVPGVGKTALIRALAKSITAESAFCQGDPDKMPRDIAGGEIYVHALGKFFGIQGPIFTHFFLADEINRNPPKALAAVVGPMEERFVTLPKTDLERERMIEVPHRLHPVPGSPGDCFFLVIATANPVEQEGTYPVPEAVLDRFPLSFSLGYPPRDEEKKIRAGNVMSQRIEQVADLKTVLEIGRFIVRSVELTENASEYMMRIIENSRPHHPERKSATLKLREEVDKYIEEKGGFSPRTNYHFEALARTMAFMNGRGYISVDDVRKVAKLMAHKLRLSYQAIADGVNAEAMVKKILDGTEVPPR